MDVDQIFFVLPLYTTLSNTDINQQDILQRFLRKEVEAEVDCRGDDDLGGVGEFFSPNFL